VLLVAVLAAGCGPSSADLAAVEYTPLDSDDFPVSTPEEQGLGPTWVAKLYHAAFELDTIHSLLVIKNGHLVAERYFNQGSVHRKTNVQSVAKSVTSALVRLALDQGCLFSVDQTMMDFFLELTGQIADPRKEQITIQHLLHMRGGYPWEESTAAQISGRMRTYAQTNLFTPIQVEVGDWTQDWEGYYPGYAEAHLSARDLAKFGLLYLNEGVFGGNQVVPADWAEESLQIHSKKSWKIRVGRNWGDNGYGYQWWSIRAGGHRYNLAWGPAGSRSSCLTNLTWSSSSPPICSTDNRVMSRGSTRRQTSIW
jgi:CubicO group peptidase (beta-lactamase class C family)